MAYTTINKSTDHFNTKLYAGNGSTQSITGVGFQPDWVWVKCRNNGKHHSVYDSVRGVTKYISTNLSAAEQTNSGGVTAFNTDGFSVGNFGDVNASFNFASWNWKAGTTSGLSGGTITPSSYSINATSGFGIYKYTGNGTSGATIAHGLGKVPTWIMVKRLDASPEWQIYHQAMGNNKWIEFTTGTPQTGTSRWNDTSPTSTLFYLGNDSDVNYNGGTYVAYVFCDVTGFSKMGDYVGNANTSGPFIYTGFKPTWIMIKGISASNRNWNIIDNKRDTFNPSGDFLQGNTANTEDTSSIDMDFLSNGFKFNVTSARVNAAETYMYMAFGQSLVGSNNVPATAR